tara:strand:+ start:2622 stop:3014 length:393 start_codon:yes stop_codon:yes gene_type:complete
MMAVASVVSLGVVGQAESLPIGLFTEDQAARGAEQYDIHCSACHGPELVSTDPEAPSLTGFTFNLRLSGRTLADVSEVIHATMPLGGEGTLEMQTVYDILAFILAVNDYEPASSEMSHDSDLSIEILKVQ